jgi:hypothetical protein
MSMFGLLGCSPSGFIGRSPEHEDSVSHLNVYTDLHCVTARTTNSKFPLCIVFKVNPVAPLAYMGHVNFEVAGSNPVLGRYVRRHFPVKYVNVLCILSHVRRDTGSLCRINASVVAGHDWIGLQYQNKNCVITVLYFFFCQQCVGESSIGLRYSGSPKNVAVRSTAKYERFRSNELMSLIKSSRAISHGKWPVARLDLIEVKASHRTMTVRH